MRKLLSIVIPRYQETEQDIIPLLSSISGQVGIDFSDVEVIIANDGGGAGALDKDFLALFGLDIRQINLAENAGPGAARQAGLDAAKGEYILFCDADDTLHNVGVLGALMQEAEKTAADILTSSWLEELKTPDGQFAYITHEQENTWMHGKVLRRAFLKKHNIRFHPQLRIHEDSYFLCIAAAAAEKMRYMPITSYVWKYHPESITRRNNASYTFDSIPTFIRACSMAHKEVERIAPEQMEHKIVQFVLYNYFCFQKPDWRLKENEKYLKDAEKAFAENIKPFWRYWENASPNRIAEIYNQERQRNFSGCVEKETLETWLMRLGLLSHATKEEPNGKQSN